MRFAESFLKLTLILKMPFTALILRSLFCLILLANPKHSFAYPVLLSAKDIPWFIGAKRTHVIAIAKDPSHGQWRRVPLQDEEIEDGVAIVFRKPTESLPIRRKLRRPKEDDPFEGFFDRYHRFVVNSSNLSPCKADCDAEAKNAAANLCSGKSFKPYSRFVRIETEYAGKVGYLADCGAPQEAMPNIKAASIPDHRELQGPGFSFRYESPANVLLDSLIVGPNTSPILDNTEMKISLRPKYMFNLDFGTKDFHAELSSLTHGPVSLSAEVATAFNLTIFQFNKQICCDINIFENALFFPVMLDLPYPGSSFLPGSGLFYGFRVPENTKLEYFSSDESLPKEERDRISTALTLQRDETFVAIGFGSLKSANGTQLRPSFETNEKIQSMGFQKVESERGIFYDVTMLPEGFNHFTVWMYVGKTSERQALLEYARKGVKFRATRVW